MASAFISYKHEPISREFVDQLKPHLIEAGFIWWIDEDLRLGDKWKDAINSAIKSAFVVLLVVSKKSLASEFVNYEWAYALGCGKRVIPILIEPIDIETLHPVLKDIQLADSFINFNDPSLEDWQRLITQIRLIQQEEDIPLAALKARERLLEPLRRDDIKGVAEILRTLDHPSGEHFLAEFVEDLRPDVSMLAAIALSTRKGHRDLKAIRGLRTALQDYELSSHAINIFVMMNNEAAIECLWSVFEANPKDDSLRRRIADGLTQMETPSVIPTLLELLRRDQNTKRVVEAFSRFKSPLVVDDLMTWFRQHPNLAHEYKIQVFKTLCVCSLPDAPVVVDFLIEHIEIYANDNYLFKAVLDALEDIGGEYTLQRLIELPKDRHPYYQLSADLVVLIRQMRARLNNP